MAQLVASMSGVVLGGVAEVVGSLLSVSIGSVDLLHPSVYIHPQKGCLSSTDIDDG